MAGWLLWGALAGSTSWADDSGTAKIVQGDVRVERSGASLPLRVGDPVREKDRIIVPVGGSAGITLRDDTRISMGPRSTLVINGFSFDAKTQEGNVDTSILLGAMRYVTGLVGRRSPASVRVATSTATIGIRGTDFIVEVLGDGLQRKRVNLIEDLQSAGFAEVSQDVTALTRLLKKAVAAGQIAMQGRHYSAVTPAMSSR